MAANSHSPNIPRGPALVLITPTRATVYQGRMPVATYDIVEPLSADDIETIRTSDLPIEEPTT